jgi:hypothetical protein
LTLNYQNDLPPATTAPSVLTIDHDERIPS